MKGEAGKGTGIVAMGEPMAEFSDAGEGRYELSFSGDAVNVAVSAARLGAPSSIIGAVGDDYFGHNLLDHLKQEGINTNGLSVSRGGFTGIYFITLLGKGEHVFTYYRKGSSASSLCLTSRQLEIVEKGDFFHFSGIAQAIGNKARRSAKEAARRAHDAGVTVSYDVNYRPRLWNRRMALNALREVADLVDIIIVSTEDWHLLHGGSDDEKSIARQLRDEGFDRVIVKAGARGSYGVNAGRKVRQRSYPVKAVDATGAGDAYDAGFLYGLLSGYDFASSLKYASMNAALKCTKKGGIRGLPTRRRLEAAIAHERNK